MSYRNVIDDMSFMMTRIATVSSQSTFTSVRAQVIFDFVRDITLLIEQRDL